jgi:hypothetical protein
VSAFSGVISIVCQLMVKSSLNAILRQETAKDGAGEPPKVKFTFGGEVVRELGAIVRGRRNICL